MLKRFPESAKTGWKNYRIIYIKRGCPVETPSVLSIIPY